MKNKGITLISLIITIIVILILSGVGISITLSVIDNTKQVAFMSKMTAIEEQINLQLIEEEMASYQGETVNSKITGDNLKLLLNEFNTLNEATKIAILEKREETFDSTKIYTEEEIANLFKLGEDITGDSSYASIYDSSVGAVYKIEPVVIGGKANIGTGKTGILAGKKTMKRKLEGELTLAGGGAHSVIIDNNEKIWTFGYNFSYQLGNNNNINSLTPIKITDKKFKKISSKGSSNIALDTEGNLYVWGDNSNNFLGTKENTNVLTRLNIKEENIDVKFKEISIGSLYVLAIDTLGNIWSWGNQQNGKLGNGKDINAYNIIPTKLDIKDDNNSIKFAKIKAGIDFSLALDSEGNIWSWGNSTYGKLGNGEETKKILIPTKLNIIENDSKVLFLQISTSYNSSSAIDIDGNIWYWGCLNSKKVLIPTKLNTKENEIDIKFIQITSGFYHSLLIDSKGNLWSWGENAYGQLGDGTKIKKDFPIKITNGKKYLEVAAGAYHSIAKDEEGEIYTWGRNYYGELGNGKADTYNKPVKVGNNKYKKVVTSKMQYTLALDEDGHLWSWGNNDYAQLGNEKKQPQYTPTLIMQDKIFKEIAVGPAYTSFAIDNDNTLWAWGDHPSAKKYLGLGGGNPVTPTIVKKNIEKIIVDFDSNQIYVIDTSGVLYGWGYQNFYNLGFFSNELWTYSPRQITTNIKDVYVKKNGNNPKAYALTKNNELITWGKNEDGLIGTGGTEKHVFVSSPILRDVKEIKLINNGDGVFAITNTNYLYAWGKNNYGILGTGTNTDLRTPTYITSKIENVYSSSNSACAITTDKQVYVWGQNYYGQLGIGKIGNGKNQYEIVPRTKIRDNVKKVFLSYSHLYIIDNNNKLYGCGSNINGEIDANKTDEYITSLFKMNNDIEFEFGTLNYGFATLAVLDVDGNLWIKQNKILTQISENINFKKILDTYHNINRVIYMQDNNNYLYVVGINEGQFGLEVAFKLIPTKIDLK